MIKPLAQDETFLRDVREAAGHESALQLWWLGQSGFLLQWRKWHLLIAPYLSDSLTRKYAGSDQPHVRMTERVGSPARLDFIDTITSSHSHTDHSGAETLRPIFSASPGARVIVAEANRDFVADRLGCSPSFPLGQDAGERAEIAGFRFPGVPAAHETVERDEAGRCRFLGFLIHAGDWALYHSGDTVPCRGLEEQLLRFSIDVAILPINGRSTARKVPGNLNGRQAAALARAVGARLAIPCPYERFELNTASPREFTAACRQLGQSFRLLRCGERWSSAEVAGAADSGDAAREDTRRNAIHLKLRRKQCQRATTSRCSEPV